jgi:hypothetical protein
MTVKGKHRKTSRNRRTKKRQTKKHQTRRRQNRNKRKSCMLGGNYEKDVTTRTTEGVATKPLKNFVVTVPGYGTMSGTAYKRLTERIDMDGPDALLK